MPPLSGIEGIGQGLGLTGGLGLSGGQGLGLTGGLGLSGAQATDGSGSVAGPVDAARAAEGASSFGASVTGAVDELRQLQSTSNELAVAAVTGNLDDIHSAMIASARASVTLELVAAVRNKGVDAFNEIMRMQA